MSINPKVSIIVPVYNVEQYLRRCIDSVLNQTFSDFELLLIDDGSKDNSVEICDEYAAKDSRIRVFHKENGGVSSARNLGLDNAKGEWIIFVDGDDSVAHDYIEAFHFDADIEIQSPLIVDEETENERVSIKQEDIFISSSCAEILITGGINTAPWAKCFKTSIIKTNKIVFPIEISYGEDSVFLYSYLIHCNTARYNSKSKYRYYIHEAGLGHKRHPIENIVRMYEMQFELYDQIMKNTCNRRRYMNIKSLSAIRELYLWYNISYKQLMSFHTFYGIAYRNLNIFEKVIVRLPVSFIKYVAFKYKYILKF